MATKFDKDVWVMKVFLLAVFNFFVWGYTAQNVDAIGYHTDAASTLTVEGPADFTGTSQSSAANFVASKHASLDVSSSLTFAGLPGTAAQCLQSSGAGAVPTWGACGGSGKIAQVVFASSTTTTSLANSTWTALTGQTVTITPSSTSSKVLILSNTSINAVQNVQCQLRLKRDSTVLLTQSYTVFLGSSVVELGAEQIGWQDSPATTSATTYSLEGWGGAATCGYQANNETAYIIAMEVTP